MSGRVRLAAWAAVLAGCGPAAAAEPLLDKSDLFVAGQGGYALYHIPGVLVTAKGTVLVWCEARKKGGDWDAIDVLLRRSTDDGKTFGEPKKIADVPGPKVKNPFALALKGVRPDDVTYNNPVLIADRDGTVHFVFCLEYQRCFYARSTDDGVTFSAPKEITATFDGFRKAYDWKVLATGPDHGIQLKTGRLVVPVWLSTGTGGNAHRPSVTATIYSDDAGTTWKAGEVAVPNTAEFINPNETVLVELADGGVLLNVRNESKTHRRIVTRSKDGATKWDAPKFDEALKEPICMGSMVRFSAKPAADKNRLLFANPDNLDRADGKAEAGKNRDRKNLSVKLSYDEGGTWAVHKPLEPSWSAYSDMGVTPKGTILCFYGRGEKASFAGDRLTLARFNLEWLTDGKDALAAEVPTTKPYDVVVVGGTPAGVACAVRAAREGLSVLLVTHTSYLGGILSNGLGVWDTLHEGKRSPIYDELRQAIFDHYRTTYGENSPQYKEALPGKTGHTNGKFEPKVAEKLIEAMVASEPNIEVARNHVPVSVERDGSTIRATTFEATSIPLTRRVTGSVFVDCTYEGDLLALAKVPYRVGREARKEYDEPHAGKVFMRPVTGAAPADLKTLGLRLFGGPQEIVTPNSTGEADGNVQAFNFRTILSSDPANRIVPGKPPIYDPAALKGLDYGSIVSPIPNSKLGWNRPQLVGPHVAYVEGNRDVRRRVTDQHKAATLALLYFLQTDPSVPAEKRAFWSKYGLAKDEFTDHGHFPRELYVREARRLDGRSVLTEHSFRPAAGISRTPLHADSVGFTDWYLDTHACTTARAAGSLDEGKMMLHYETRPAQVPYRSLLPKGVDNLLVPVCLSASHVAWGAVRLEPTWMQVGEAAGFAAKVAKNVRVAPAAIDADRLVRALADQGHMLVYLADAQPGSGKSWAAALQYFATKGFFDSYHARPDDPLTPAVADRWAAVWAKLAGGKKIDPTEEARAVAKAVAGGTVTGAELLKRLNRGVNVNGFELDKPITRGEACRLLYAVLAGG